jgi:fucose 4-O-acetylase-like acetyltransferase
MDRKKWADVAKTIAIVAVIVGHTSGIPDLLSRFIFSFHMPLFFILSGYFTKECVDLKKATVKDAKSLLVPYVLTCGITIVLAMLRAWVFGQNPINELMTWAHASLYGSGTLIADWAEGTRIIGAIWFLLALFFARFFWNYTERFKKYDYIIRKR